MKKQLSIAKFGGSLLDIEGKGIPKILKSIRDLKTEDSVGPIAVFSAPTGCTDELVRIGESCAQSMQSSVNSVFKIYDNLAAVYVKGKNVERVTADLAFYKTQTEEALVRVNRRFSGSIKAKVLAYGGELATSVLMNHILQSNGVDSAYVSPHNWPVVTDDDFEDATPSIELSQKRLIALTKPLQEGKVISMAVQLPTG